MMPIFRPTHDRYGRGRWHVMYAYTMAEYDSTEPQKEMEMMGMTANK